MRNTIYITGAIIALILVPLAIWFTAKNFQVWSVEMTGKANLARAEQEKKIKIADARAEMESASLLAKAEVERAKGVAKANAIIGDSLKGNEGYLRYLYINNLAHNDGNIIYVPTEAGLPILEAGRLK